MGRSCPIDFKRDRKVRYDTRNPLLLQEGHIDMISLIIHEFCQIWEGVVRLTSNLVGRCGMKSGIHYRSKDISAGRISLIIHEFCQIWEGVVRLTSILVGRSGMTPVIHSGSRRRYRQDLINYS